MASADAGEMAAKHDPRARLRRLHEAFTTMLDKTFETMPFDDFKGFFGREFGEQHADYLFDLYSSYLSHTRSNSEEEFGVLVFQTDLEEKLARLDNLLLQHPEGAGGVALLSSSSPLQLARAARMEVKMAEMLLLKSRLQELDEKNDAMKPIYQQHQQRAAEGAAVLRTRKVDASNMLASSAAILA